MSTPSEPISAFVIYSEKLRQKKTNKKPLVAGGLRQIKTKTAKHGNRNILIEKEVNIALKKLDIQPSKFEKHNSSSNKIRTSKENTTDQIKLKVKVNKKHTSNKSNKQDQLNKKKLLNQETKVNISHIDSESALRGLIKNNRKQKLNPKKSGLSKLQQKSEKVNLIKQKKKRIRSLKNGKTKVLIESNKIAVIDEDKTINVDKEMFKERNKSDKVLKPKKKKQLDNDWSNNSALSAKHLFEWLILPIKEKDFMSDYWEKQPLLVQREGNRSYFSELISTLDIDSMIRKNNVQFTKHLDVTSYIDQKRETHNLSGRAHANVVWDFYTNGCSIRLLNPQVFLPKIHTLNATLQGYFGCFVGANVYLTPPNSQGFAPHYDDIEAFVLQIEGKKQWKVYGPRTNGETLPRLSSPNFTQDEIGDPILDVTLEPGDLLYFPRGFIHQASTVEGEHSLHITLSAYQKTAWIDLLEKAIPIALERAAAEDVEFRRGLPRNYLGIEFHGSDASKMSFINTAKRLMSKVADVLQFSLGAGVDKMGAQFMHDALPPVFTPQEKKNMVLGNGLKMKDKGKLVGRVEFEMETEVKLSRENICRLIEEEGELRLYHCLDNSLEYHAEEPQFLVLPPEGGPIVTVISSKYPAYVQIKMLPHTDEDALLTLVSDLWDAGILVIKEVPTVDEEN